ncbi:MAG TPA: hypothetical protein VJW75_00055 [Candidatus Eisenbacteria bacterium]|nr:hypothetical protein [Candidatus Eisenbacteria bacterium]
MTRARRFTACFLILGCLTGAQSVGASVAEVPSGEPTATPTGTEADSTSEDGALQFAWAATYASWYSFQGLDYSNRRSVSQPEVSATMRGVSISAWGNFDHSLGELNEIDLTLQWGWEGERLSGGVGYANLHYPHRADWEPSQEVLGELAFAGPLEVSASVHWDVDEGRGRYWELGLGKDIEGPGATIALGATVYFQDRYYELTGIPAVETRVGVRRVWAGVAWEPSLARLWTWENGDFEGPEAVEPGWIFSLSLSPP